MIIYGNIMWQHFKSLFAAFCIVAVLYSLWVDFGTDFGRNCRAAGGHISGLLYGKCTKTTIINNEIAP
jgi:hypothetical protein